MEDSCSTDLAAFQLKDREAKAQGQASLGQEVAAGEAASLGGPAVQAASRTPLESDSRDPLLLGSSEGTHVTSQRPGHWRQVEQVAALDPCVLTLRVPNLCPPPASGRIKQRAGRREEREGDGTAPLLPRGSGST